MGDTVRGGSGMVLHLVACAYRALCDAKAGSQNHTESLCSGISQLTLSYRPLGCMDVSSHEEVCRGVPHQDAGRADCPTVQFPPECI